MTKASPPVRYDRPECLSKQQISAHAIRLFYLIGAANRDRRHETERDLIGVASFWFVLVRGSYAFPVGTVHNPKEQERKRNHTRGTHHKDTENTKDAQREPH